jgi:hypothetical protein
VAALDQRARRVGTQAGGAPGVYVERLTPVTAAGAWRTDIAGFVGLAEKGEVARPVRIESADAFRSAFGDPVAGTYLAHAVRGFFANGGRTCWVARVGRFSDIEHRGGTTPGPLARTQLAFAPGDPVAVAVTGDRDEDLRLGVTATSPGRWAQGLEIAAYAGGGRVVFVVAWSKGSESYPLDGGARLRLARGEPVRMADLSLQRLEERTAGRSVTRARLELADDREAGPFDLASPAGSLRAEDLIGEAPLPEHRRGLALLAEIEEVSMLAAPDLFALELPAGSTTGREAPPVIRVGDGDAYRRLCHASDDGTVGVPASSYRLDATARGRVRAAMVRQAETLRDRIALFDAPADDPFVDETRERLPRSTFVACYSPWLEIRRLGDRVGALAVPPCGHVAGAIAGHDLAEGVASPPANLELVDVADLTARITDARHAGLNERGINVVRTFFGGGIRIMGARTFAARDADLRWLHARRLVSAVGDALFARAQWTVFEPHDAALWRAVERMANSLLAGFWRRGILAGATREEAFFARCDAETNPPAERAAGRLVCLVGLRPVTPAEFVVLRFGLTRSGYQALPAEAGLAHR